MENFLQAKGLNDSWLKTIIQNVNFYVLDVQCNNAMLS